MKNGDIVVAIVDEGIVTSAETREFDYQLRLRRSAALRSAPSVASVGLAAKCSTTWKPRSTGSAGTGTLRGNSGLARAIP